MKKQFFYAAMAIAMMASCTSEDNLSVDPIIPDEDDKVAIELGVDAPTVSTTVGGRSVGSVGDVADAEGTEAAQRKNVWNGEQLYIAMVDKSTGNLATEKVKNAQGTEEVKNVLDHQNYVYYAPKRSGNSNSGTIRMYTTANKPANGNADGTRSYVYYPVSGQYDFYGWHLDDAGKTVDAEGNPTTVPPTVKIEKDNKTVSNIIINGQQDIMGARTKGFTEANYFTGNNAVTATFTDMVGWDFSARTARNKIHPILKFEHQLARLKFFVKAGSDKTAEYKYVDNGWVKNQSTEATPQSTAMQVKSIKVLKMIDNINMNLEGKDKNGNPAVVTTSTDAEDATFVLGSRVDGVMTDLVATAPKYYCTVDNPTAPSDADYDTYKDGTQVGESVMFFPGAVSKDKVELQVELAQLVQTLDQENGDTNDKWEEKTQTANLTVHASSLINQTNGAAKLFEPGKSYNVYITIYGFERIDITAELTAWENGGDVNVDVEEEQSRHDVKVNFKLQDAAGVAISGASFTTASYTYKDNAGATQSGTATFAETSTAGTYEATVPSFAVLNYTIEKDGFENATGLLNARNGQEVTITMKAAGTAPTTKLVTLKPTLNGVPVANAEITVDGYEVSAQGTINVPVETTQITYSVVGTAEYEAVENATGTITVNNEVEIALTAKQETKNLSFIVTGLDGTDEAEVAINGGEAENTTNGKFTFEGIAKEEATYLITADGYFNVEGSIAANETEINATVTKEKDFTFSVTNDGGADAVVKVFEVVGGSVSEDNLLSEGIARLTCGKTYKVTVDALEGSWEAYENEITIASNSTSTIEITLDEL